MTTATYPYRSSDYLDDDEMIAEYAEAVLEENDDPAAYMQAIESILRAHGLRVLAETTGLSRKAIIKALSGEDSGGKTMKAALVATSHLTRRETAE